MNRSNLACRQILTIMIQRLPLFLFFFLGLTLSILIFLYAYGNLLPQKRIPALNDQMHRTFAVHFAGERRMEQEDLEILDAYPLREVWLQHISDIPIPYYEEGRLQVRALRFNNQDLDIIFTPLFTQPELEENLILLSPTYQVRQLNIGGIEYRVARKVGHLGESLSFIPMGAFLQNKLSVDSVHYVLTHVPSLEKISEIMGVLQSYYPSGYVLPPAELTDKRLQEDATMLTVISVFFALSMVFFALLFLHLLEQISYEIAICRILGAKKEQITKMILLQMTVISAVAYGVALALHRGLYGGFDQGLNMYQNILYTAWDYLLLFVIIVTLSAVVTLPVAIISTTKTEKLVLRLFQ